MCLEYVVQLFPSLAVLYGRSRLRLVYIDPFTFALVPYNERSRPILLLLTTRTLPHCVSYPRTCSLSAKHQHHKGQGRFLPSHREIPEYGWCACRRYEPHETWKCRTGQASQSPSPAGSLGAYPYGRE